MMGRRAISGSLATKLRNAVMACTESSMASSCLTSDVGSAAHLFERHRECRRKVASLDQVGELL